MLHGVERSDAQKSVQVVPVQLVEATPVSMAIPVDIVSPTIENNWSSGLCDCFSDLCTCCTVFCVPCIPLGQLWQRLKGPKGSCILIIIVWTICVLAYSIFQSIGRAKGYGAAYEYSYKWGQRHQQAIQNGEVSSSELLQVQISSSLAFWEAGKDDFIKSDLFIFFWAIICAVLLCLIRMHVRKRDKISPGYGCCQDCCISFWCAPCVSCQILRHEGLNKKHYELCHPEGGKNVDVNAAV